MPIKFRCSYCRQFLGISRSRAGEIVDCPTCGRSIRVPGLDGSIQPTKEPERHVRDEQLSRALDELATLNQPVAASVVQTSETEAEPQIPQRLVEPIPIEVPVPPEPMKVSPRLAKPIEHAVPIDPVAELAQLAQQPPAPSGPHSTVPAADHHGKSGAPHRTRDSQPLQLAGVDASPQSSQWRLALSITALVVTAIGGICIGRLTAPAAPQVTVPTGEPPTNSGPAATTGTAAIAGRISYKTQGGDVLPDRGARVLILPTERASTAKLPSIGFRLIEGDGDSQLAVAMVRGLGGDFVIAEDDGHFAAHLTKPGLYTIVVLSKFVSREESSTAAADEAKQTLAPFFDHPETIVGKVRSLVGTLRYRGTTTEAFDHVFNTVP